MRLLVASLFLSLSSPVLAADCATDLKATDTYKELSAKLKCLNDRISALEGSGNTSQKAALSSKPVLGTQTQEGGGVKLEIESCAKAGANFSCRLFITATSGDQNVQFDYESKAVDASGTVFRWKGFQTAGQQMETGSVSRSFIGDVRTASTIFFEGGDKGLDTTLSALQLKLYTQGKLYIITFRNLQLM